MKPTLFRRSTYMIDALSIRSCWVRIMTIKTPGPPGVLCPPNSKSIPPQEKLSRINEIEYAHDLYHKPVIFKIPCFAKNALFFFPRISILSVSIVYPLKTKERGRGGREWNTGIPTHGNTQQANRQLHARNDIERFQNSGLDQPVVRAPGEAKAEHVLEDK